MALLQRSLQDIVIVGGGVVGSLLGCLLADSPRLRRLTLGLVEPQPSSGVAAHVASGRLDGRTYALSPASARLLASAGVWDAIVATGRAPAYTGMHVWDALGSGRLSFGRAGLGLAQGQAQAEPLGYLVEHEVLAGALWERLQAHQAAGRLELHTGARLASLALPASPLEAAWPGWGSSSSQQHLADLTLSSGQALSCRLLVAADGALSPARAAAGVGVLALDYAQHAVCATVRLSSAPGEGARGTAWQRFLPLGPLAVLPLWEDYASIVWSTSPAHARALKAMPGPAFAQAINTVLQAGQGEFEAAMGGKSSSCAPPPPPPHLSPPRIASLHSPPTSFPLRLQLAQGFTRPRLALLGDAAHTIHPLAGQGLNQGLADCRDLCRALEGRAGGLGEDCGSGAVLAEYSSSAGPRNLGVALGVHGLQRLFAGRGGGGEGGLPHWLAEGVWGAGGLLPALRTAGLQAVSQLGLAAAFEGLAKGGGGQHLVALAALLAVQGRALGPVGGPEGRAQGAQAAPICEIQLSRFVC